MVKGVKKQACVMLYAHGEVNKYGLPEKNQQTWLLYATNSNNSSNGFTAVKICERSTKLSGDLHVFVKKEL